ncbi:SDR family NAD(P)-dependent oxidoreductase [Kordiimonas pumila]|uniref:SDR family NAD(P)-dependent oxidoreductase n=1 Tax=Kordiimonas pumila TaxID=2161677 RepID=A0ABV7D1E4_9PROT|nr:SDR family NAD(P)-dependent oxidoreductase [Kordiimonas pumila]
MKVTGLGAVVTGGSSGLGGATAEALAAAGAKVTIFDVNEEAGLAQAKKIGGKFVKVDVTNEESVIAGLDAAEAAHGTSRILVNCAGIVMGAKTVGREAKPFPMDQFRKVIDVNLIGSYNVLSKFAARLSTAEPVGEERGVIVNTASVAAFDGQIGQAAYSASKAAIAGIMLPVARDLAQFGIRVCAIAPGIFWTPMLAGMSPELQESLGSQVPFPSRMGKPEEYALLAMSIIDNPMLNGETIRLDGAIRMAPR